MLSAVALPLEPFDRFMDDPRTPTAAESFLRRGLEALLDLGRHLLSKGFGQPAVEYKTVAQKLLGTNILNAGDAKLLRKMAGYRNRLVHFYNEISANALCEICVEGLKDVETAAAALEKWIRDHPERIDHAL